MNPVTNNPVPARNNFSIENILSKPDRVPQSHLMPVFSVNNSLESVSCDRSIKIKQSCDHNANMENIDDIENEQSDSRHSLTSPDSSCCDDGNEEINDTGSEHNCKWAFD